MTFRELEKLNDERERRGEPVPAPRLAYVTLENHPRCAECLKRLGVNPADCKPLASPQPCVCCLTEGAGK